MPALVGIKQQNKLNKITETRVGWLQSDSQSLTSSLSSSKKTSFINVYNCQHDGYNYLLPSFESNFFFSFFFLVFLNYINYFA